MNDSMPQPLRKPLLDGQFMIECPRCNSLNAKTARACAACGLPRSTVITTVSNAVLFQPDGSVVLNVHSANDAIIAVKELKVRKKELLLERKYVRQRIRELKADYAQEVRMRNSKFQGGGKLGRIIRMVQTANRDSIRQSFGLQLDPLNDECLNLENRILFIDNAMHQLEVYLSKNP